MLLSPLIRVGVGFESACLHLFKLLLSSNGLDFVTLMFPMHLDFRANAGWVCHVDTAIAILL
jgi:hypothetical protein